jgi:phospholipid/cholesterol/gamma-HCH transport system substrate-binding protein
LFGEWTANIVPFEPLPVDPNLRDALVESDQAGGEAWPGATLPDIGQLTAQASRIAGDVAAVTQRIGQAFDSTALNNLQQSVKDLATISGRMAHSFEQAGARLDTATSDNRLKDILDNGRNSSADIRAAAADLRSVMAAARSNQASWVHAVHAADSLMTMLQTGSGTIGKLATDSTLYHETTQTVIQFRQLLTDIKANPKKYLKISVF